MNEELEKIIDLEAQVIQLLNQVAADASLAGNEVVVGQCDNCLISCRSTMSRLLAARDEE